MGRHALGQIGVRLGYLTMAHIFTLRAIVEELMAKGLRIYCCVVDFHKAFDIVLGL